jgi:FkbH-like protein
LKLIEALKILRQPPAANTEPLRIVLACGFMPVHLETFLSAHLRQRNGNRPVEIETGLFGDLAGTLERLLDTDAAAAAVVIEWPDLDPRLGIRTLGGWLPDDLPDIYETVTHRLAHYADRIKRAAERLPVALCLPTLPLPPFAHTPGHLASAVELDLRRAVAQFAVVLVECPGVRLVRSQRLDQRSPADQRRDVNSELGAGFPYSTTHADAVADLLAALMSPAPPKKGLITDLDDTLWRGILGEGGVEGIAWDLDQHAHIHGLYQQLLHSLSQAGVLIAVASKNNADLVDAAFERDDMVLPRDAVFPMEVHWGRKSESVARILDAWNIGADSVVLVDDSPIELAEVQAAHPDVECLQFPTRDPQAAYELLERLRDLFGKERVSEEDAVRLRSLRQDSRRKAERGKSADADEFLARAEARLTLRLENEDDARAFELINKTNQFNLNGRRIGEKEWLDRLSDPESFLLTARYEDKFGPLGEIAAVLGHRGERAMVDTWVMSCRAFGRRIEHRCLEQLFALLDAEAIEFAFEPTDRNLPLAEFFARLLGEAPTGPFELTREQFAERCPALHHAVEVDGAAVSPGEGARRV